MLDNNAHQDDEQRTSTTVVRRMSRLKRRRPCSNSVSGTRLPSRNAMSPNIVFGPVAIASPVPVPLTTDLPRNTRWDAFGSVAASGAIDVGRSRLGGGATRRSASIAERKDRATRAGARPRPADSRNTSPGTTFRDGVSSQKRRAASALLNSC